MKYKCLNCNETYDEKYVALKCCYNPAQRYICGICNEAYYNYETARNCCAEDKVEEVEE